jgi:hypothetical protein
MSYSSVDPIIVSWATKHQLFVYSRYQDLEVRSVDVVDLTGHKFQIWIDPPKGKSVSVHAWDYKKRRKDWNVEVENLNQCLNEALYLVKSWGDF